MKNNTGLDYDFDSALNSELPFDVDSNGTAQVLIYHTHTSESYMDEDVDYFYESYYSRTQNNDYNVTACFAYVGIRSYIKIIGIYFYEAVIL